jgi:hypothetical protein
MASERIERKLAAIVAADVAGYSRLMAADEEGTLARLKAHRKALIDPKIGEHGGRIIKTTEVRIGLILNRMFTIRRYRAGAQSDNPVFLKQRERLIEAMQKAGIPGG